MSDSDPIKDWVHPDPRKLLALIKAKRLENELKEEEERNEECE